MRRILPALFLLLIFASFVAVFLMLPSQLKEFGQSVIASTLFLPNVFFWLKTDYWAESSFVTPLLHLWSLGVEEQFYLIFPFLLIFIKSNYLRVVLPIILVLSSLLFLFFINSSESFYLLPFRFWELATGSIGVFFLIRFKELLRKTIVSLSFFALIFSFILFDETMNQYLIRLIPIISTFLIIIYINRRDAIYKILANKKIIYIGSISYSLYLFHQPVFAFMRIAGFSMTNIFTISFALFLTFSIASMAYKFVEIPFRDKSKISRKLFFSSTAILLLILLFFGAVLHYSEGLKAFKLSKMNPVTRELFLKYDMSLGLRSNIWSRFSINESTEFITSSKPKILFIGDSLSKDLFVASSLSAKNNFQSKWIAFDDECIKNTLTNGNETGLNSKPCSQELHALKTSKLVRDSEVIVIAEYWLSNAKYLENFLLMPEVKGKKIIVYLNQAFPDMKSLLLYANKDKRDIHSNAFKNFVFISRQQRTIDANSLLIKIANKYKVSIVDSFSYFCDEKTKTCTIVDSFSNPILIDEMHLSGTGVVGFSSWFINELRKSGVIIQI